MEVAALFYRPGNDTQPIWLQYFSCGSYSHGCLDVCTSCPLQHSIPSCNHSSDVTVQCGEGILVTFFLVCIRVDLIKGWNWKMFSQRRIFLCVCAEKKNIVPWIGKFSSLKYFIDGLQWWKSNTQKFSNAENFSMTNNKIAKLLTRAHDGVIFNCEGHHALLLMYISHIVTKWGWLCCYTWNLSMVSQTLVHPTPSDRSSKFGSREDCSCKHGSFTKYSATLCAEIGQYAPVHQRNNFPTIASHCSLWTWYNTGPFLKALIQVPNSKKFLWLHIAYIHTL